MIPEAEWAKLFEQMDENIKQIKEMTYETRIELRELKGTV